MFEFVETKIPDCFEIKFTKRADDRGVFVKTFNSRAFKTIGPNLNFAETYYSVSQRGVLRGLHFQVPPMEHAKLIYCLSGKIFDVVLDLRIGSPMYGKPLNFFLSYKNAKALYLPAGVAHGFLCLSRRCVMAYHTTTVHSPTHDAGLLWSSAGIEWPMRENLIISNRDSKLPQLSTFQSPFVYETPRKSP